MTTSALPALTSPIPRSTLGLVENHTPLRHFHCQKMGPGKRFHDVLVVKGTFALRPDHLELLRPDPIVLADQVRDPQRPTASSLAHAGEVLLGKPSTDVIVTGSAHAPGGRALREWHAEVEVRDGAAIRATSTLHVTGPRWFVHGALRGWGPSEPEPTTHVPIAYELAYGGRYQDETGRDVVHKPNPSGRGLVDERRLDLAQRYPAPQWQLPNEPVTTWNRHVGLAGFGPVARSWQSRLRHAGTYDATWEAQARADAARGSVPDYAPDFDARFFQCAHPALVTDQGLRGGEALTLRGLVRDRGELTTTLPALRLVVGAVHGDGLRYATMALDTVHVDVDAGKVWLCWRHRFDAGAIGAWIHAEGGIRG